MDNALQTERSHIELPILCTYVVIKVVPVDERIINIAIYINCYDQTGCRTAFKILLL